MQKRKKLTNYRPKVTSPDILWIVPVFYIILSLALGRIFPQLDLTISPSVSYFSPNTATSLLSAIASGMIALTGFVFSMMFVMVQFGSSAYTPRIARYFILDPLVAHALGIFIATFIYSLIALAQIDISSSGEVPNLTVAMAMVLLLSSTIIFLFLIRRTVSLQISHVLHMLGDRGDDVIRHLFPLADPLAETSPQPERTAKSASSSQRHSRRPTNQNYGPLIKEIYYEGRPKRVLQFDLEKLVRLAQKDKIVIQILPAVGDMITDSQKIIAVYSHHPQKVHYREILNTIHLGLERTVEQDPRFAIRLIVDIAIRALSPAVNDPTTAVQALDQLYDLLRQIARRDLDVGYIYDRQGELRITFPTPDWNDFLSLAIDEIRYYGAGSIQVMRRLRALLVDLKKVVPPDHVAEVDQQLSRVNAAIMRSFTDPEDRALAKEPDRQGISIVE